MNKASCKRFLIYSGLCHVLPPRANVRVGKQEVGEWTAIRFGLLRTLPRELFFLDSVRANANVRILIKTGCHLEIFRVFYN